RACCGRGGAPTRASPSGPISCWPKSAPRVLFIGGKYIRDPVTCPGSQDAGQGLRMKLCLVGAREGVEQAGEVVWVEGGLEAFGREAALGGVGAQEVEGDL